MKCDGGKRRGPRCSSPLDRSEPAIRRSPRPGPGGVRAGVWLFATACFAAALGATVLLARIRSERHAVAPPSHDFAAQSRVEAHEPAPAPQRPAAALASPERHEGASDTRPSSPAPAAFPAAVPRLDAGYEGASAERAGAPPGDSRLAAEIGILESEAARVAEALGLAEAERAERSREATQRQRLADAVLVEHFVQDAYRGTLFPIAYPAEERTRTAAESLVRGLTPELRRNMLEAVLARADLAERIGPHFEPLESGHVWEGARN